MKIILKISFLFLPFFTFGQEFKTFTKGSEPPRSITCRDVCKIDFTNYIITTQPNADEIGEIISLFDKRTRKTFVISSANDVCYFDGIYKNFVILNCGTDAVRGITIYDISKNSYFQIPGGVLSGISEIKDDNLFYDIKMSEKRKGLLKLKDRTCETSMCGYYEKVFYNLNTRKLELSGKYFWTDADEIVSPEMIVISEDEGCDRFCAEYEAFADEYVSFMKRFNENPSDQSILSEYVELASRLSAMQTSVLDCSGDQNAAERIKKAAAKIASVSNGEEQAPSDFSRVDTASIRFLDPSHEAQYKGDWAAYISKTINRSLDDLVEEGQSGTCEVLFTVSEDGSVSDVEALTMKGTLFAQICMDAIKKGGHWKPGRDPLGNPVPSKRIQKVKFTIPKE